MVQAPAGTPVVLEIVLDQFFGGGFSLVEDRDGLRKARSATVGNTIDAKGAQVSSFVRNQWHVAAYGTDIGCELFPPRTILGEPIVFYRTEAGDVVVLADRCVRRRYRFPKVLDGFRKSPGRRQDRLWLSRVHLRPEWHLRLRARPGPDPAHRARALLLRCDDLGWEPGAHLDLVLRPALVLGPDLVRRCSLCGDPADSSALQVAVPREPEGFPSSSGRTACRRSRLPRWSRRPPSG